MREKTKVILLLSIVWLFMACASEPEVQDIQRMPVYLSIPVADVGEQTRAPGDPGNYEHFELPRYLWLYMVVDNGSTQKVEVVMPHQELNEGGWIKEKLGTDSVYTYASGLMVDIPSHTQEATSTARIYALMSYDELDDVTNIEGTTTEAELKDLKFSLPVSTDYSKVIRNIYSSPFELKPNGVYYGTVKDFAGSPYVENFVLYHVGAKLDVQWNVTASKQADVRMSKITVNNLKKNNCYAFKPLENIEATSTLSDGYPESFTIDIGGQWYGRHSFYVIPYGTTAEPMKYPINLELYKNGGASSFASPIFTPTFRDDDDLFTPWIVVPLQVNPN